MVKVGCEVPGCENKLKSRGYCSGHYKQWRRCEAPAPVTGELRSDRWGRAPKTLEEFFWMRVKKTDTCWLWQGKKTVDGYGQAKFQGKTTLAHRFSWELLRGSIPEGHFIDHLCHVTGCVNPGHLRTTDPKGNAENRRGATIRSRSGIRGVSPDTAAGSWRAEVKSGGKRFRVKGFKSPEAAGEAARKKRQELFPVSD